MDLAVTHVSGDRFAIQVRGHRLVVDQPVADGGQDAGPTPTELFAASLAACVGFYAERFLRRHDLEAAQVVAGQRVAQQHRMTSCSSAGW